MSSSSCYFIEAHHSINDSGSSLFHGIGLSVISHVASINNTAIINLI
uniref:Uncharacterized protein n=1 Tax=Rhizophora mucronata TaxID=61149 RepID=A0A2P2NNR0_RHIMU